MENELKDYLEKQMKFARRKPNRPVSVGHKYNGLQLQTILIEKGWEFVKYECCGEGYSDTIFKSKGQPEEYLRLSYNRYGDRSICFITEQTENIETELLKYVKNKIKESKQNKFEEVEVEKKYSPCDINQVLKELGWNYCYTEIKAEDVTGDWAYVYVNHSPEYENYTLTLCWNGWYMECWFYLEER